MADEITIRRLGPDDLELLLGVGEGLFDHPVRPDQARAFLDDPLHEIVLALEGGRAVAMASGNVLLHPDKPPAFFINEVGTCESHRRRGLARRVTAQLIEIARARGCNGVWLGTERDNAPAQALYRAMGGDEVAGVYFGWDGALDD